MVHKAAGTAYGKPQKDMEAHVTALDVMSNLQEKNK
jgi:hypothetical protein